MSENHVRHGLKLTIQHLFRSFVRSEVADSKRRGPATKNISKFLIPFIEIIDPISPDNH